MHQMKLNHSSNYNITLYRVVNEKVRYYSVKILPTLFGEFLLLREYGAVKNKEPTRVIKKYFSHIQESVIALEALVREKIKKGYFLYPCS